MKITAVDAIPLEIGFARTFRFGTTDRTRSPNVIVRLGTEDGIVGYGEACPVPAFTGETQTSVVEIIQSRLGPLLLGADALAREPLLRRIAPLLVGCPFTLAAVDMALWDLAGKAFDVPASTLMGGREREVVELHGSVGIGPAEEMVETALAQVAEGYRALKLYAGREPIEVDLDRLRAVRNAVGPSIPFLLDVNGLWRVGTCLRALPTLDELGVVLLEQPLPAWDRAGLAEVVMSAPFDVAGDESVFGPTDVVELGRERSVRVVNLGLSKLGGAVRAQESAVAARSLGLGVMVGSVLELGIATAAGIHLAATLPELAYPSYLVGPLKYERHLTDPPLRPSAGEIRVPVDPGLGVAVDEDLLRALDLRGRS